MDFGIRTLRSILFIGIIDLVVVFLWVFFRISTVAKVGSKPASLLHVLRLRSDPVCTAQHHVAFIKVQKSGSSTVQNVFYRFGTSRNLAFLLPTFGNYVSYSTHVKGRDVMPLPGLADKFDLSCNHVKYSRTAFEKFLYSDTSYVGIVRHPFTLLNSYIYYFLEHVVPGEDKLWEFLRKPDYYASQRNVSLNLLTNYYGLDAKLAQNSTLVQQFTEQIDKDFRIILILELLDESLLVMKREFCWNITDILYVQKNVRLETPIAMNATVVTKDRHRAIADADYVFYRHFYKKMQDRIFKEGVDFHQELQYFRQTKESVRKYCTRQLYRVDGPLKFKSSPWQSTFAVTEDTCRLLLFSELEMQDFVGTRQYGKDVWQHLHRVNFFH